MGAVSKIEWTNKTWNPVRGCTRVSAGCGGPGNVGGCYAEGIAARFSGPGQPYHGFAEMRDGKPRWTGKLALIDSALLLPLHWKKPARIFVNSMSDLFHESLPDEAIDKVFAVMALCPEHTFQCLTKRPARMREYLGQGTDEWDAGSSACWRVGNLAEKMRKDGLGAPWNGIGPLGHLQPGARWWPLANVWLGTSCEDQATANARIPDLLATPSAIRFISAEPLLGPIDLTQIVVEGPSEAGVYRTRNALTGKSGHSGPCGWTEAIDPPRSSLDWVIVGGESGPHARPMHPQWARSLRDQCGAAGVPFFFKQWGEFLPIGQHLPGCGKIHGATAITPGRMKLHYFGSPRQQPEYAFAKRGVQAASTPDNRLTFRVGKARAGRLLDGIEHNAFPEVRHG